MKNTEELLELITREVEKEIKKSRLRVNLVNTNTSSDQKTVLSMFKGKATSELNPDIFFIGKLSFGLAGRLAHCSPMNSLEEQLLRYLMEGKRVVVAEEGIEKSWLDKKIPYALRQQQRDNFNRLQKYQIEVVRLSPKSGTSSSVNKKVLYSESRLKLMNLESGSELTIENNSLFTDLAKDYLKKNKIELVTETKEASQ